MNASTVNASTVNAAADNSYYAVSGSWGGVAVTSADSLIDLCPGDVAAQLSVAVSGFILLMICNFLLIIGLGESVALHTAYIIPINN
jgi:hypothetical protein